MYNVHNHTYFVIFYNPYVLMYNIYKYNGYKWIQKGYRHKIIIIMNIRSERIESEAKTWFGIRDTNKNDPYGKSAAPSDNLEK